MSSKTISMRDLLKVSWLSHCNEVMLLDPEMDEDVNRALATVGFDTEYPLEYFAAQHRDMSGRVAIGYMIAGEVQCNRAHLTSKYATLEDVLIASAYLDTSLTEELGKLRGLSRTYDNNLSLEDDFERNYPKELVQLNWNDIERQIYELNELCVHIRGPKHSDSGGLKTTQEYKEFAAERKTNNKGSN